MITNSFWLIVCGAGAIQSLFLSIYFFLNGKIGSTERTVLGLLLLAITLRLIKSIGWFFFDIEHTGFLNMGFVAHGFIGPLLALYFLVKSNRKATKVMGLVMILPAVVLMMASLLITLRNFWYAGGYQIFLYVTVAYLLVSGYLLVGIYRSGHSQFAWMRNLFIGVALFNISYFTNYILGLNPYMTGPIVYSLAIYFISYAVFTNHALFTPASDRKKYKNINLSDDQIQKQREKVVEIMSSKKPYLDSDFSLTQLSEMTSIPKYLLSRFFSESMNQSFTDFTNGYRIEKARSLLKDPAYDNHKIAFIAYECGFNSLSSFNTAFKKVAGMAPSEYKKTGSPIEN